MIDIQKPIQLNTTDANSHPIKRSNKIVGIVLLIVLVVAVAWVLWYFFKPFRTISLTEGQSYTYGDYIVTLARVTDSACQELPGVTCEENEKEFGVQVSVRDQSRDTTSFGYVALDDNAPFEIEGLRITAEKVDFGQKEAKIKLIKTQ